MVWPDSWILLAAGLSMAENYLCGRWTTKNWMPPEALLDQPCWDVNILWREMREGLLIHTHPTRLSYTDSTTVEKVNVHPKFRCHVMTNRAKDAIPRCNRNKSPWDGSVPCPAGWLPQENTATSIFLRSSWFTCSEGAYFAQIFNYWILTQVIWLFLYVPPWLLNPPLMYLYRMSLWSFMECSFGYHSINADLWPIDRTGWNKQVHEPSLLIL